MDIENETDISEDEKGFPILMEEVELVVKEMKNGKATGVDGIPIELVKCLGEGKKEILSLCNKIYNEVEWPEEFMEVLLPIHKKNNAKKCKRFMTIGMISRTAKTILRIVNRRLRSNMEEELEEEQFGFRKGRGTRDAVGLVQTIGERYTGCFKSDGKKFRNGT